MTLLLRHIHVKKIHFLWLEPAVKPFDITYPVREAEGLSDGFVALFIAEQRKPKTGAFLY